MKAQLLIFLALSALIMLAESAANPYNAGSACNSNDYCPSYCTYGVNSADNKLVKKCLAGTNGSYNINNGGCTDCDPLFFTLSGTFCIPHGLRNEYKAVYRDYTDPIVSDGYRLGWYRAGGGSYNTRSSDFIGFKI